jgi:hypothetical protein
MFVLNPEKVQFGSAAWPNVVSVAVDSAAVQPAEDWGDGGPWCVLVDCPQRRVALTVKQELRGTPLPDGAAELGAQAELKFYTSPSASSRGRVRVKATAVITGVSHEHRVGAAPVRVIELLAVSADGAADPVAVEAAEV